MKQLNITLTSLKNVPARGVIDGENLRIGAAGGYDFSRPLQCGEIFKIETIDDESELLAISKMAQAKHLHLITNGKRSVLCSIIPPGWKPMRILEK